MGSTTAIEWADATWNPWRGCHKVSQGCKNCYMFRDQKRYGRDPNVVVRAARNTFFAPMTWARTGKVKPGARIFTCSWSDWFIEEADPWRSSAWATIKGTPQFTYLILTKRPERILDHLPPDWGDGWPNVWLGVSCEDQENADRRIPWLLGMPAAVRFVSAEPLLGLLDLGFPLISETPYLTTTMVDWVITGGESDYKAPRPCDLDWVRDIRDQCRQAGVAYFHKQNGGNRRIDGVWGGRVLDGRTWDEYPDAVTR